MDNLYKKVIQAFSECKVEYLIVGGFAVNFHGYNRTTVDLNIWINIAKSNLSNLNKALQTLGYEFEMEAEDRLANGEMISFFEDEYTVELMPRMNISQQTTFKEAFKRSDQRTIDGMNYSIIALTDLINEKAKSKRYKDLDDLSKLEEAAAYYAKKSKEK